jgi:hypothetical protein
MLRRRSKRKSSMIRENIKKVRKNIRNIATPVIGAPTQGQRLDFLAHQKKKAAKRVATPTTKKNKTSKKMKSPVKKKSVTKKKITAKKLPKMAENYAKEMAKTTGLSVVEVKQSKPFKTYLKALKE